MIYLAGPMDMPHGLENWWWREAAQQLQKLGHTVYNPHAAWKWSGHVSAWSKIRSVNRAALQLADCVLVGFADGQYGFETIREIEFADACGIPIVAFGPKPNSMGTLGVHWCVDQSEAMEFLGELDESD